MKKNIKTTLLFITSILFFISPLHLIASRVVFGDLSPQDNVFLNELIGWESTTDNMELCDTKVGKTYKIKLNRENSRTQINMRYNLTRTDSKKVEIGINPIFYRPLILMQCQPFLSDWDSHCLYENTSRNFIQHKKNTNDYYLNMINEKFNACLKEKMNPMKGENYEFFFKIDHTAPKHFIHILPFLTETRAHSKEYNYNIDCHTIVHEVFHITGLIDEYADQDYSKRIVFNGVSYMKNQDTAFEKKILLRSELEKSILYPNCNKKNKKYYDKADFAYKH